MSDTLSDLLSFLFPLGIILLVSAISIGAAVLTRQRLQRQWSDLASRAGLSMEGGSALAMPSVVGTYRGRPIRLHTYTRSHGRSSTRYSAINLTVSNPAGGSLSLRRERWYDSVGQALGMEDIQIGDALFDQRFRIASRPPEFAVRVFQGNEPLRSALMQAPPVQIELQGGMLHHRQTGLETNTDRLMALFDVMSSLADAVERAGAGEFEVREEVRVAAAEEEAEETAKPVFASDVSPAEKPAREEPFGQFGAGGSYDPFARPRQGLSDETRRVLIIAFLAFDCLVVMGVLAYLFLANQ